MSCPEVLLVYMENNVCRCIDPLLAKAIGYAIPDFLGKKSEDILSFIATDNFKDIILERYRLRVKGRRLRGVRSMDLRCKDGTQKKFDVFSKMLRIDGTQLHIIVLNEAEEGIQINLDQNLANLIQRVLKRHKWLAFDSVEKFGLSAIREKIELLLSTPAR